MRVFRFLVKEWLRLWWPGAKPPTDIDVRKWAEQIENVNRITDKLR